MYCAFPHGISAQPLSALHIVLCLIVADVYGRHSRGIVRILSYTWFGLIGISTVLTWQHHLVDVAGGLMWPASPFTFSANPTRAVPPSIDARDLNLPPFDASR